MIARTPEQPIKDSTNTAWASLKNAIKGHIIIYRG